MGDPHPELFVSRRRDSKTKPLRETSFKNRELCAKLTAWHQSMHFAIFPPDLSKVLHLSRKSEARSYEVLQLSADKISVANLNIRCFKMQPLSGNPRPVGHVCCATPATWNASLQILVKGPRLPSFLFSLTFGKVQNMFPMPHITASKVQKCSKKRSETVSFNVFDFEMCFAP